MALREEDVIALTEHIKKTTESSISDDFIIKVIKILDSFGCEIEVKHTFIIALCIDKVEMTIKNECNTTEIPEGLQCHAAEMVCGEYLAAMYRTGQLVIDTIDLSGAIASVDLGGAKVAFDNNTSNETKLNGLISLLLGSGRGEFACYRKIKWF